MWRGYLLVAVAGCGFTTAGPVGDPIPDGGTTETWQFDNAVDFADTGYQSTEMTIDPRGSLTPNAYAYGVLVAHGVNGTRLWNMNETSWGRIDGAPVSGIGLWCGEHVAMGTRIEYLGVPSDAQQMSVWFEGEVWLEVTSSERFSLTGNDIAFVDLARPGSTEYRRILAAGPVVQGPVTVMETGWHPIRIGWGDADRSRDLDFVHSDGGPSFVHWTRDRMRARTSDLTSVASTVFARQVLGGGEIGLMPVLHLEAGDLLTQTGFSTLPAGASSNGEDWSAHFAGQLYVAQAGKYTLGISSDDGNRARLADQTGSTSWTRGGGNGTALTSIPATLKAGWNDVVVDYNQTVGARRLAVTLDGPDFSHVAVPRDQLRPVEPRGDRIAFGADDSADRIPDAGGGQGVATMTVAGYTTETIAAIDLTLQVNSAHWDQLRFELERPGAAPVVIRDRMPQPGDGRQMIAMSIPSGPGDPLAALLGGQPGGDWRLRVTDVLAGGGDSTLELARITVHTAGGPDNVAPRASWTSPVLDAVTRVFAIDHIDWEDQLPPGSTLHVEVRACAQPDCSDGMWSVPVSKKTRFPIPPGRYLQLRVEMTSDGTREPELRSLTVMYRRDLG